MMAPVTRHPVVAVVNTNPDLVELLKDRIEEAGFVVLVLHVGQIRSGADVQTIVAQHDPNSDCVRRRRADGAQLAVTPASA